MKIIRNKRVRNFQLLYSCILLTGMLATISFCDAQKTDAQKRGTFRAGLSAGKSIATNARKDIIVRPDFIVNVPSSRNYYNPLFSLHLSYTYPVGKFFSLGICERFGVTFNDVLYYNYYSMPLTKDIYMLTSAALLSVKWLETARLEFRQSFTAGYNWKKITIENFSERGGAAVSTDIAIHYKPYRLSLIGGYEFHQDNNAVDFKGSVNPAGFEGKVTYKVNRPLLYLGIQKSF